MTGHLMYVIREGGLVCLNKNVEKKCRCFRNILNTHAVIWPANARGSSLIQVIIFTVTYGPAGGAHFILITHAFLRDFIQKDE